jgi:hypothetical protein
MKRGGTKTGHVERLAAANDGNNWVPVFLALRGGTRFSTTFASFEKCFGQIWFFEDDLMFPSLIASETLFGSGN